MERPSIRQILVIFCATVLILNVIALPANLWFESYLLRDPAEALGFHYLLSHGYRINLDFDYYHGLLSLLFQEFLFSILGAVNWASEINAVVMSVATAAGLAIFAYRIELGFTGFLLFLVSMPFAVLGYRGLDAVLLVHALAQHACGRRDRALALSTASCLAKPSMGYVYDFVLVVLIIEELRITKSLSLPALARSLLPATVTATMLMLLLSAVFGRRALLTTILPLRGAAAYRAMNFGFFTGIGNHFWYFSGVHLGYYLGTPVAFWLAATVWLLVCAARELYDGVLVAPNVITAERLNYEIVITCALLHLSFITLCYGSLASWLYYAYILVMGVAATATWARWNTWRQKSQFIAGILVLLATFGNKAFFFTYYERWMHATKTTETANLWAFPKERQEWIHVLQIIKGARATLLVPISGGELLSPEFERPVAAFLIPGQSTPSEIANKAAQLAQSDFIVMPTPLALGGAPEEVLGWWPELKKALDGTQVNFHGKYFEVYERVRSLH